MKKNIAVVLFNIGGPENLKQVKPYLFNFFSDKFIIKAPYLIRKMIAFLISQTRGSKTTGIYEQIGGKSFSKENTQKQADELEKILNQENDKYNFKTYICMSYWHPMTNETLLNIKNDNENYKFEKIIYLPLYPHFSTTTTESSFFYWKEALEKKKFKELKNKIEHKFICCFYDHDKFINAHAEILMKHFKNALDVFLSRKDLEELNGIRILFSAHSIPEKLTYEIKDGGSGDPYQFQIQKTTELVMKKLKLALEEVKFDYKITYQSKIGPVKWLEPSTEAEVINCAKEKLIPIIVPIAFVSENSETIYELDIEYKDLLKEHKMDYFFRCETLSLNKEFLNSLKDMVLKALISKKDIINANDECSRCDGRKFGSCPNQ